MKVVAEVGCNHQGDLKLAKEHIRSAKLAGCDYVKFQKRDNEYWLLRNPDWEKAHPNIHHAFGETYFEHRAALEFTITQHAELKTECEKFGIGYACSAWDMQSAVLISGLNPDYIKIPSACNLNFEMMQWIAGNTGCDLHVSLGMSTEKELDDIEKCVRTVNNDYQRIIPYLCTSGYPVPFGQIHLLRLIDDIKDRFYWNTEYGFSGHHLGIAIDVAARTLGATWVERHFTLDRTFKGTDHAASLEPGQMSKLVRDLRNVEMALKPHPGGILEIEKPHREKLKWHP